MGKTAFPYAAEIERSLELLGERCRDPTPFVYDRLFGVNPEMKVLFWRDSDNSIKGEMLSRVFEAILDFIGERQYAAAMIGTEMITHEGYDVPRDIFATFFAVVAEVAQELLGPEWTPDIDHAWREMLKEIDGYAQRVPIVSG